MAGNLLFLPMCGRSCAFCVLDFLACALEAHARCLGLGKPQPSPRKGDGRCTIIGSSSHALASDAAFANAVAAHGLVREDMHTGSVSHLGVVVLPALFAMATGPATVWLEHSLMRRIVGYEVGAKIGRATGNA